MQLFDLTNKVAVVTGGSGVLGSAICQGLADVGVIVVILARKVAKAQVVVDAIQAKGGQAQAVACDVIDKSSIEQAHTQIMTQYGRVDILINAAGGNHPSATALLDERSFFDLPEDALQWVFNLNLMGTLYNVPSLWAEHGDSGTGCDFKHLINGFISTAHASGCLWERQSGYQ